MIPPEEDRMLWQQGYTNVEPVESIENQSYCEVNLDAR